MARDWLGFVEVLVVKEITHGHIQRPVIRERINVQSHLNHCNIITMDVTVLTVLHNVQL